MIRNNKRTTQQETVAVLNDRIDNVEGRNHSLEVRLNQSNAEVQSQAVAIQQLRQAFAQKAQECESLYHQANKSGKKCSIM